MPLFQPTQAEKFTPKKIKLTDFYKSSNKGAKINEHVLSKAKEALRNAGISDAQIARDVTANKPIDVSRAKDIIGKLNRAKVYGFERDPKRALKTFLNKERVKAQNIAGIRKEHIIEAAEENLAKLGTTSLNRKAVGPNSDTKGQASVFSRRRAGSAIRSLTGGNTTRTTSFATRTSTASLTRPGVGSSGSSISIKPKF